MHHFLSKCKFLPSEGKAYMTKVRTVSGAQDYDSDSENDEFENQNVEDSSHTHNLRLISTRLVSTKQSPYFKAFYKQYPVKITLDTGAEISMVKAFVAQHMGPFEATVNLCRVQPPSVKAEFLNMPQ